MKKKTLQTIKKHNLIERGMHIVVGLSGGPDSVCLFDILCDLAKEMELSIYAVHINHKLRPGAAEADQKYVEELCEKRNVPCHVFVEDCNDLAKKLGLTSEEAGRKVRYESFGKVALSLHEKGIPKNKIAIALAHNANDQCETILFRMMRGTGTDGLAGIPYKRFDENNFSIVRPILDMTRSEIEEYCEYNKLSPRIDHTNSENIYARNKIRNMLIPFLADNFNENIVETINRLGKIASEDRAFFKSEASKAYSRALIDDSQKQSRILDTNVLSSLHNAIRFRVYTVTLEHIGMEQNITYAQGELIDKVLLSKSPSAMCDLSDGFVVLREYDRLVFRHNSTNTDNNAGWRLLTLSREEYEEYKERNQGKLYGAFSGVDARSLCLRTRKAGDRIDTGKGTKKLQDFYVDQKVPKNCRDDLLILAKGSDILWVLPSEKFLTENLRQKGRFSAGFKALDYLNEPVIILEKL